MTTTTKRNNLSTYENSDFRRGYESAILKNSLRGLLSADSKLFKRISKELAIPRNMRKLTEQKREKVSLYAYVIKLAGKNYLIPNDNSRSLYAELRSCGVASALNSLPNLKNIENKEITVDIKTYAKFLDKKSVPKIIGEIKRRKESKEFTQRIKSQSQKNTIYKSTINKRVYFYINEPSPQKKYKVEKIGVSNKIYLLLRDKKKLASSLREVVREQREENLKNTTKLTPTQQKDRLDFFKKMVRKEAFLCYPEKMGQSVTVEMEVCDYDFKNEDKCERVIAGIKSCYDGSLSGARPREFVMPLLDKTYTKRLKNYLNVFRNVEVNKTCGLHIHLDMRGKEVDEVQKIYKNLYDSKEIFKLLVPASRLNNQYCKFNKYNCNSNNLTFSGNFTTSRYCAVNYNSYSKHGTIEVRAFAGSCDFEKISKSIELCLYLQNNPATTVKAFFADAPIALCQWIVERMRVLGKNERKIATAKRALSKRGAGL